jgi:LysR substrate binding domain
MAPTLNPPGSFDPFPGPALYLRTDQATEREPQLPCTALGHYPTRRCLLRSCNEDRFQYCRPLPRSRLPRVSWDVGCPPVYRSRLRGEYASRDWFETACKVARIQPRVLLESGSPHASIALAAIGYGIAVVPSRVLFPREHVRGIPSTQRGAPIGRWLRLVWEPQRFLAAYAETFVYDLVDYCRRNYPGHEFSLTLHRCRDRSRELGKASGAEVYDPGIRSLDRKSPQLLSPHGTRSTPHLGDGARQDG